MILLNVSRLEERRIRRASARYTPFALIDCEWESPNYFKGNGEGRNARRSGGSRCCCDTIHRNVFYRFSAARIGSSSHGVLLNLFELVVAVVFFGAGMFLLGLPIWRLLTALGRTSQTDAMALGLFLGFMLTVLLRFMFPEIGVVGTAFEDTDQLFGINISDSRMV